MDSGPNNRALVNRLHLDSNAPSLDDPLLDALSALSDQGDDYDDDGVNGRGFIAKDMGFRNTAGPKKFQAVALRSSADRSVFYRCFIDGYQDTLYTHTGRQFYGNCVITGTVDFIFGNAAVGFQNCSIHPKQPLTGQFNTLTAQGKTDPNQNTGIAIQRSWITPLGIVTANTYL